jgi:hypothetical protein
MDFGLEGVILASQLDFTDVEKTIKELNLTSMIISRVPHE